MKLPNIKPPDSVHVRLTAVPPRAVVGFLRPTRKATGLPELSVAFAGHAAPLALWPQLNCRPVVFHQQRYGQMTKPVSGLGRRRLVISFSPTWSYVLTKEEQLLVWGGATVKCGHSV